MDGIALYELYEKFVLPQFGIKNTEITWDGSDTLGPDEEAHYFNSNGKRHSLIFEDYGGLAVVEDYIRENIDLKGKTFTYIKPESATEHSPSWIVKFDTPYQYCHNVTGAFTLIELDK
jgi:hypothetical protein